MKLEEADFLPACPDAGVHGSHEVLHRDFGVTVDDHGGVGDHSLETQELFGESALEAEVTEDLVGGGLLELVSLEEYL